MEDKILEILLNIQSDVNDLKKDMSSVKEDVGILKQDVSGLKEDVGVLKQDVSGLKQEMSTVKSEIKELKKEVDERFDVVDINIDMMQKSIVMTRVDIKNLDKKLTGQIATNMETIEDLKSRLS